MFSFHDVHNILNPRRLKPWHEAVKMKHQANIGQRFFFVYCHPGASKGISSDEKCVTEILEGRTKIRMFGRGDKML